ncbi:MAG: hypothetical protein ACI9JK_001136 [Phycisphaerales bacterium]|jgi:hypothetical protein
MGKDAVKVNIESIRACIHLRYLLVMNEVLANRTSTLEKND